VFLHQIIEGVKTPISLSAIVHGLSSTQRLWHMAKIVEEMRKGTGREKAEKCRQGGKGGNERPSVHCSY
jgi:hypothetical protein